MRIVTTCHKAGWEQYGNGFADSLALLPQNADFAWYSEGYDFCKRNEDLPRLQAFKAKYAYYRPPDWRYDVVRFSNKVYAVHDALYKYDGIGVWMDADMVLKEPIPDGYLESLLPNECYIALFQREGWHSECGLWVVDCTHPEHKRFLDTLLAYYEQDKFKEAHEWHDSVLMDATIRAFEREHRIKAHNLSGPHSKEDHPMAFHPIARYLDHLKGPTRKKLGYSPERKAHEIRLPDSARC